MFDFIISALTAVGYFSSVPDLRRMLQEASDLPLQKELLHLNPEWLCAILMIAIVVCMLLKVRNFVLMHSEFYLSAIKKFVI